jgi:hypothetical protein
VAIDGRVLAQDDEIVLTLGVAYDFIPDMLVVDASRVAGLDIVNIGQRARPATSRCANSSFAGRASPNAKRATR